MVSPKRGLTGRPRYSSRPWGFGLAASSARGDERWVPSVQFVKESAGQPDPGPLRRRASSSVPIRRGPVWRFEELAIYNPATRPRVVRDGQGFPPLLYRSPHYRTAFRGLGLGPEPGTGFGFARAGAASPVLY